MDRETRQIRSIASGFATREEEDGLFIDGYFSVFNSPYELWEGASEIVAEGAFDNTLGGDIRCLIDHDTRLVLGRNKAGTLELKADTHGLWGRVKINPKDSDAMNLYERVKRGDVDQCSFGFDILREETELLPNDEIRWIIKEVKLYEVSVVTFPAYTETSVSARKNEYAEIVKRKADAMREELRNKLYGGKKDA